MSTSRYLLSFTAANLALHQSRVIAQQYREIGDWPTTASVVQKQNLIQARTKSALIRVSREISKRLQTLHPQQIDLLCDGTLDEQKQVLWLAVCKRYAYIREFAIEVIHEKFVRGDLELTEFDYISFYNRKADWHPELDAITESTRNKLRTTLFYMLRQAGITNEQSEIIPVILSSQVRQALDLDAPLSYSIFPVPDRFSEAS